MSAESQSPARPDLSIVVRGGDAVARETLESALGSRGWIEAEGFLARPGDSLPPTQGRYLALLSPGVEVDHGNLAELVAAMDARPRCGLAGVVAPSRLRKLGDALLSRQRPTEDLLIVRAEAIAEVGPLDLEGDWSRRLRAAGWSVEHLPVVTVSRREGTAPANFDDRELREERYRGRSEGRSLLISTYYNVKPLLPRPLQLALRRRYAKRQARVEFPRWPIEPILVERRQAALRAELAKSGAAELPTLAPWPDDRRFAAILTHDVEGPKGVALVRRIMEIERRHGFRSSWNFVGDWYPIEPGLFDHVRAEGHEIGLHGIKHDCKLFESRTNFEAELPEIHHKLREWDAVGFRAPATHRNADWMEELGAAYDSSFPDTDPFEPLGGGCCSILPFFLGEMVELPITLVQDHTLWEILRRDTIDLWTEKSDWIAANGGLINLITHPDYLDTPARLRMYEEFLVHLNELEGGWYALPRDIADWWRLRRDLRCVADGPGLAHVEGPGSERARIEWASAEGTVAPLPVGAR
jgi:peptidoglycan/xylan/chitin deacetylase (PgdA/CDA1 family)